MNDSILLRVPPFFKLVRRGHYSHAGSHPRTHILAWCDTDLDLRILIFLSFSLTCHRMHVQDLIFSPNGPAPSGVCVCDVPSLRTFCGCATTLCVLSKGHGGLACGWATRVHAQLVLGRPNGGMDPTDIESFMIFFYIYLPHEDFFQLVWVQQRSSFHWACLQVQFI